MRARPALLRRDHRRADRTLRSPSRSRRPEPACCAGSSRCARRPRHRCCARWPTSWHARPSSRPPWPTSGGRRSRPRTTDRLMELAAEVVSTILDADRVAVLELGAGGRELELRADSGRKAGGPELEPLGLAALGAGRPTVPDAKRPLRADRAQGRALGRHRGARTARRRARRRRRELRPGRGERARRCGRARARGAARGAAPAVAAARERRQARRRRRTRLQQPARRDHELRGLRARGRDRRRAAARSRGALKGGRTAAPSWSASCSPSAAGGRWTPWRSTSPRWCATWSRCCAGRSASTSSCAAGRPASCPRP